VRFAFRLRCALSLSCSYSIILLYPFPGDFFTAAFQCPHRVERAGTLGDGGKWVCGLERVAKQRQCVIYSFGPSLYPSLHARSGFDRLLTGINGESSFERELLLHAPGCEA